MQQLIAKFIDDFLPKKHEIKEIELLYHMMGEYPNRGGKMIRGQLVIYFCLAYSGTLEKALPLAAAIEILHNWALIHDDIEDESEQRRGKPALHREFGVALALNAGDALHSLMWKAIVSSKSNRAIDEFFDIVGKTTEGQHMELTWIAQKNWDISVENYLEMVKRKTAYYTVVAPLKLGAIAAGKTTDFALERCGIDLGIAFQIRDDVLNLTGDFEKYGKESLGDLFEGKRTLVLLNFLSKSDQKTRNEVITILNKPRNEKTASEIKWILDLIKESGAIDYAQKLADDYIERGLQQLKSILSPLNAKASEAIWQIANSLASRGS